MNPALDLFADKLPDEIRLARPATPRELEECLEFRWRHLRAPYNLPRGSERDAHEHDAHQLAARTAAGELIGVSRLHLNEERRMQMRYMAVAEPWRRRGVATAMLARQEARALALGHDRVVLNAREGAMPFYLRRGYRVVARAASDAIPGTRHYRMEKRLLRPL